MSYEPFAPPLAPPDPTALSPSSATGPDRGGFILAAGIVMIVIGGLMAFMGLMTTATFGAVFAAMPKPANVGSGFQIVMVLISAVIYLIPAANLLTCGIGSVRFRPWARTATVVSSWVWLGLLLLGAAVVVFAAVFAPSAKPMKTGEAVVLFTVWGVIGLFTLALPTLLLVLYSRRDVKETFEQRDAARRR